MATLILGSQGQLGTAFRRLLPDAVAWTRQQLDLAKPETVRELVRQAKPAVVLNCAAYNAVDRAESDIAGAFAVNAFAVRELALACRDIGATLVHFSTNYVFGLDAARREPYRETDAAGPVSAYGVSKLAGEYFPQTLCPEHLVIRTCGLFGPVEKAASPWNFVEKLLDRAGRGEKLRVVNDQSCTPTAAADLAEGTLNLLGVNARGLYHWTNAGACSWHEFAAAALRNAGLGNEVEPVASDVFAAPAKRPGYSVLACDPYDRHRLSPRRSWQEAIRDYFSHRK